jgi:hypothetical protein
MRGWPLATIAFYGPNLSRATKVVVGTDVGRELETSKMLSKSAEFESHSLRQDPNLKKARSGSSRRRRWRTGVGKSRLCWEFLRSEHTQGWQILESRSVSYGKTSAYLPVIDLLKAYCEVEDRDDASVVREKVAAKIRTLDSQLLEPSMIALLSLLGVPVEDAAWERLDPAQRRQQTLDGVKRLLPRTSQVRPLVLFFEDLHWIDGETQALLDSVVESLPTARLLLLVNYRPEYQHAWGSKTYYRQLRIDPLAPESAGTTNGAQHLPSGKL